MKVLLTKRTGIVLLCVVFLTLVLATPIGALVALPLMPGLWFNLLLNGGHGGTGTQAVIGLVGSILINTCLYSVLAALVVEHRRVGVSQEEVATPEEKARCFTLLDDEARKRYDCFVSEFFLTSGSQYEVCLRPLGITKESTRRYACVYVEMTAIDVRTTAVTRIVPVSIQEKLADASATLRIG